jgi:hypothetical protein
MGNECWFAAADGTFQIRVPPGWQAEWDAEEGTVELWNPEGAGDLSLLGFAAGAAPPPVPAEELYVFLDEHDIELQEDEVEDMELSEGGELAYCEYVSEDEQSGEATFALVGVGSVPGALVFADYTCAAGEEGAELEQVHAILGSLRSAQPDARPGGGA